MRNYEKDPSYDSEIPKYRNRPGDAKEPIWGVCAPKIFQSTKRAHLAKSLPNCIKRRSVNNEEVKQLLIVDKAQKLEPTNPAIVGNSAYTNLL